MTRNAPVRTVPTLQPVWLHCVRECLRSTDRTELLTRICQALTAHSDIALAWVGMRDEGDPRIWPQAHSGRTWSPARWLAATAPGADLADHSHRRVLRALQSDRARTCTAARRTAAVAETGSQAEMLIPLHQDGTPVGILAVYARHARIFRGRQRTQWLQLGADIDAALARLASSGSGAQAASALSESEARYSMLFANNSLPMLVLASADGRIIDANARALDFYGMDHAALTALHFAELGAQVDQAHYQHRIGDGAVRQVEVFTTPIHWHGETCLIAAVHDITAQLQARERIDALLQLNALAFPKDPQSLLEHGLALARQLTHSPFGFALTPEGPPSPLQVRAYSGVDAAANARAAAAAIDPAHSGAWSVPLRNLQPQVVNRPDAQALRGLPLAPQGDARLLSTPIVEDGVVRLLIGVAGKASEYSEFDVETLLLLGNDLWRMARRAQAEADLQQRVDELLAANRKLSEMQLQLLQKEKMASIGQLAAGVAHEINNPVGFIKSNLNTLNRYTGQLLKIIDAYRALEPLVPADSAALAQVRRQCQEADFEFLADDIGKLLTESAEGVQRVSQITADLKNFSRPGDSSPQWTDLHAGIESTINMVWSKIKYKAKVVRAYGQLPPVLCVGPQINQVILNLLVNAEQSIKDKGTITLRTGTLGDQVWIEVEDTGCGIPAERLNRIFEPFYTTKAIGEGTGLGLSISFGIVQRHGGSIAVRSTPGAGTVFRIQLPIGPGRPTP